MGQRVVLVSDGHRVDGCGADGELVNRFLAHLGARAFSPATVRAYAFDLLCFGRFCVDRRLALALEPRRQIANLVVAVGDRLLLRREGERPLHDLRRARADLPG